jgi:hypothetical protein
VPNSGRSNAESRAGNDEDVVERTLVRGSAHHAGRLDWMKEFETLATQEPLPGYGNEQSLAYRIRIRLPRAVRGALRLAFSLLANHD